MNLKQYGWKLLDFDNIPAAKSGAILLVNFPTQIGRSIVTFQFDPDTKQWFDQEECDRLYNITEDIQYIRRMSVLSKNCHMINLVHGDQLSNTFYMEIDEDPFESTIKVGDYVPYKGKYEKLVGIDDSGSSIVYIVEINNDGALDYKYVGIEDITEQRTIMSGDPARAY